MKKPQDILEFHIVNNFKRLQTKMLDGLSDKQIAELQKQLDLHNALISLRTKKSRGYASLEVALRQLSSEEKTRQRPFLLRYRLQFASVSVMAILAIVVVGGLNVFKGSSGQDPINASAVQANGTVDNLSNLTLLDAQNDIQATSADTGAVSTAQAELTSTTNLEGVINENF